MDIYWEKLSFPQFDIFFIHSVKVSYPHRCGKVENYSDFSDFFGIKVEKHGIFNEFLLC